MEELPSTKYPKHYASKFLVYRAAVQGIPNAAWTTIQHDTIVFDTLNEFDEAVTYQFTPIEAGYYFFVAHALFPALPVGTLSRLHLWSGGVDYGTHNRIHDGVNVMHHHSSALLYLTPALTVEARVWQNSLLPQNLTGGLGDTDLAGFRVG